MDSWGRRRRRAETTVKPPTPESKTPIASMAEGSRSGQGEGSGQSGETEIAAGRDRQAGVEVAREAQALHTVPQQGHALGLRHVERHRVDHAVDALDLLGRAAGRRLLMALPAQVDVGGAVAAELD